MVDILEAHFRDAEFVEGGATAIGTEIRPRTFVAVGVVGRALAINPIGVGRGLRRLVKEYSFSLASRVVVLQLDGRHARRACLRLAGRGKIVQCFLISIRIEFQVRSLDAVGASGRTTIFAKPAMIRPIAVWIVREFIAKDAVDVGGFPAVSIESLPGTDP